jgi:CelD/BcsL family acetyltransferase involved in cellulose biosynthesis
LDSKLSVSEVNINDRDRFHDYKNSWNKTLALNGLSNPFLTFEWIDLWLNNFLSSKPLKLLFVKENQQTKAIVPLFKDQIKLGKFNLHCLQLPANSHSNRCEFLIGEKKVEYYQVVLDFLFKNNSNFDSLFLRLIPETSSSIQTFNQISQDNNFLFSTRPGIFSPSIVLPESWDQYLLNLGKKNRYELRKREKHWDKLGQQKEEYFTDESNIERLIDSVLNVEMNSWKAKEQKHLLTNQSIWNFYNEMIRQFAKFKLLHSIVLSVNEVPIAYELAIVYNDILYSIKTSYNEIFQKLNCGYVLRAKMLKRAFELGLKENDLLGDNEPWKQRFANKYQKHFYIYLLKNNMRNRLIWETEFKLRPIAGKIKRGLVAS